MKGKSMYYRPEEWRELHPDTVRYLKSRGMGRVLDYINDNMNKAWHIYDNGLDGYQYDGDDMANFCTMTICMLKNHAFGAYNALLVSCGNERYRKDIYRWGHYSVFY